MPCWYIYDIAVFNNFHVRFSGCMYFWQYQCAIKVPILISSSNSINFIEIYTVKIAINLDDFKIVFSLKNYLHACMLVSRARILQSLLCLTNSPSNFITSVQPPAPHPGMSLMWQ